MLRRSLALGSLLAAAFVVGCQEPTGTPVALRPQPSPAAVTQSQKGGLVRNRSHAPSLCRDRCRPSSVFGETATPAINPDDYVCSSDLADHRPPERRARNTLADGAVAFFAIYNRYADLIPTYEALYFQTSATPQTYGYNGEFTKA